MVYLYFWDKKRDRLCVSKEEDLCIHPRWDSPDAAVKGCARFEVSSKEGKIFYNKLWLKERNDDRAIAVFYEYYNKERKRHDNESIKLWKKLDKISRLPVVAYD